MTVASCLLVKAAIGSGADCDMVHTFAIFFRANFT